MAKVNVAEISNSLPAVKNRRFTFRTTKKEVVTSESKKILQLVLNLEVVSPEVINDGGVEYNIAGLKTTMYLPLEGKMMGNTNAFLKTLDIPTEFDTEDPDWLAHFDDLKFTIIASTEPDYIQEYDETTSKLKLAVDENGNTKNRGNKFSFLDGKSVLGKA